MCGSGRLIRSKASGRGRDRRDAGGRGARRRRRPGTVRRHALRVGDEVRPGAAGCGPRSGRRARGHGPLSSGRTGRVGFEEDERSCHPRSPYTRVDALRSGSRVRVEVDGVRLADAPSCVMVFRDRAADPLTNLDRVHVDLTRMIPSDTVTPARTRAPPAATGRADALRTHETWPGRKTSRPANCCPFAGWCASINERWTSPWTAGRSPGRPSRRDRPEPGLLAVSLAVWAGLAGPVGGGGATAGAPGIPAPRSGRR